MEKLASRGAQLHMPADFYILLNHDEVLMNLNCSHLYGPYNILNTTCTRLSASYKQII